MLYQSRPQTIEAIQWTGDNSAECYEFCKPKVRVALGELELKAGKDGAQDWVPVPVGHWLVNQPGDKSDVWPVDPDYFAGKYDALEHATPDDTPPFHPIPSDR